MTSRDQFLVGPRILKIWKDQDQDQWKTKFGLSLVLVFFSLGPVQSRFFCGPRTGPLNTKCESGGHENEGQQNDSNIDNQTVPLVVAGPVVKQPATFHLNAKAFKKGPSALSNVSYIL